MGEYRERHYPTNFTYLELRVLCSALETKAEMLPGIVPLYRRLCELRDSAAVLEPVSHDAKGTDG